jgi:hypothetical protein
MSEIKNEELVTTVDALIERVIGVAEVADQAFPGKNLGPEIKKCADVIKLHLTTIVENAETQSKSNSLHELAVNNCSRTFKLLEGWDAARLAEGDVKLFEILTTHARELFEMIQYQPKDENDDPKESD